ncbi:putative tRNA(His) guanylyltransferase [Tritrichomonas foetus]|uniref:tRNA(His) guanylyltransferase n=1 Tax=Tritrichomonas foetus TaxID=1144522 RepID=A0A1J4JAM5_9EUKA|nr:putative tRNA(His) guanylyltransferase [Tritrichomonas foetus]|eukprot:OHS95279.1 putative tRNA(His) guanylyltransferase [Tritrichomonas foetus]
MERGKVDDDRLLLVKLMVNSRFEYVKQFEAEEKLLRDTFICVDVHATDFDQFCIDHNFLAPYDDRIIRLNAACARNVMNDFGDIDVCFGCDGEFSFIFRRSSTVFNRRRDKLLTNLVSLFVSTFAYQWKQFFNDSEMKYPPNFVSTIKLFPRLRIVKDYLLFLQLKATKNCQDKYSIHILERSGMTKESALEWLKDASLMDINEMMFKNGINFNFLPDWHKRGKILFREKKIIEISDDLSSQKPDFWKKHKKLLKE